MTKTTVKSKKVAKNSKLSSSKSAKNVTKVTKNAPAKKIVTKAKKNTKETNKVVAFIKNTNPRVTKAIIFIFGILLIFSSYAWFSTNLNVKIKTFNMVVAKNSDLTISFDGVNFDRSIEISKENIYDNLGTLYPNYLTQWPANGLIPVSSPGLPHSNTHLFDVFETNGVLYRRRDRDRGFLTTTKAEEHKPREFNYYLAFDIFIKNNTGSPTSDNLYLESSTDLYAPGEMDEEMQGLVNSFRVGMVKVGSVDLNASAEAIQNISCNNNCEFIIYEPNSKFHTPLSIERAKKYGVDLVDGDTFPTYAFSMAGGPIYVENAISGSSRIDRNYFSVQETMTEDDINDPIFTIPNGITKFRIYVWIEGQDIDSLETHSKGTEVEITIDFVKDVAGWAAYDE